MLANCDFNCQPMKIRLRYVTFIFVVALFICHFINPFLSSMHYYHQYIIRREEMKHYHASAFIYFLPLRYLTCDTDAIYSALSLSSFIIFSVSLSYILLYTLSQDKLFIFTTNKSNVKYKSWLVH